MLVHRPILLEEDYEMSVYDLKDHPDYKFRPGLSVVPVGGLNDVHVPPESSNNEITSDNTSDDTVNKEDCIKDTIKSVKTVRVR